MSSRRVHAIEHTCLDSYGPVPSVNKMTKEVKNNDVAKKVFRPLLWWYHFQNASYFNNEKWNMLKHARMWTVSINTYWHLSVVITITLFHISSDITMPIRAVLVTLEVHFNGLNLNILYFILYVLFICCFCKTNKRKY